MNIKTTFLLSAIMLLVITKVVFSQNVKLAQSGLKFLSVGGDAKAVSLAGAVTSVEGNSSSIFYNPASISRQTSVFDVTFANTSWIADINYINTAITFAPSDGLYGVFGFSIASVDYGEFKETIIAEVGGNLDIGIYSPTALAVGGSYARALSNKFSVGGNVRYIYQNIGDGHVVGGDQTQKIDIDVFSFDFGVLYKTGFKSLNFGMSVRNFSQEIQYVEESFQLPLSFSLGLSMNLFDFFEFDSNKHSFLFAVDAEHPRDNKEMLHLGAEYTFMEILSLRAGYITPKTSEAGINAGFGVKYDLSGIEMGLDYAYTEFGVFNDVHRISVKLSF